MLNIESNAKPGMPVRNYDRAMDEVVREEGIEGLRKLPGIDETLSRVIHQLVSSGRLPMLERLRGESDPVEVLASVPCVGIRLAERLYTDLGIDSLEELEAAAHDGRLAKIEGFGGKRIAGIKDSLPAVSVAFVNLLRTFHLKILRLVKSWMSIVSTEPERIKMNCLRLRRKGSIRNAKLGCRFCIPRAAIDITQRCFPTRHTRIRRIRPTTG
jgi:DNA polymerase/3'-5' exonuclease PolX